LADAPALIDSTAARSKANVELIFLNPNITYPPLPAQVRSCAHSCDTLQLPL
jgi:hypothetical protein